MPPFELLEYGENVPLDTPETELRGRHQGLVEERPSLLAAWPEARVNLEVKSHSPVDAVAEAIGRTASLERVCLNSFFDRPVQRLRRRFGPWLCTSFWTLSLGWFRVASFGLLPSGSWARPIASG